MHVEGRKVGVTPFKVIKLLPHTTVTLQWLTGLQSGIRSCLLHRFLVRLKRQSMLVSFRIQICAYLVAEKLSKLTFLRLLRLYDMG
jgi:hypothetical protein